MIQIVTCTIVSIVFRTAFCTNYPTNRPVISDEFPDHDTLAQVWKPEYYDAEIAFQQCPKCQELLSVYGLDDLEDEECCLRDNFLTGRGTLQQEMTNQQARDFYIRPKLLVGPRGCAEFGQGHYLCTQHALHEFDTRRIISANHKCADGTTHTCRMNIDNVIEKLDAVIAAHENSVPVGVEVYQFLDELKKLKEEQSQDDQLLFTKICNRCHRYKRTEETTVLGDGSTVLCPACGSGFERSEGCRMLTCTQCEKVGRITRICARCHRGTVNGDVRIKGSRDNYDEDCGPDCEANVETPLPLPVCWCCPKQEQEEEDVTAQFVPLDLDVTSITKRSE